ncbi:MAG: 23S rRNA (adenine(2503)-C(2))-methyltransferase RlmN [Planctomycetales bacterium]|nr:23S rRNA (adenine(2503)-C(2))-methyltransferase RlmN [Planctomycetales bacterium]
MRSLVDLTTDELATWLAERGEKPFRAKQIRKWLYQSRASSWDDMTDLPKGLRAAAEEFSFWSGRVVHHARAADGTEKLLIAFGESDRERIECVLLRDGDRRTICISSQVGCAMGCVFCASGLDGVDRNLTRGEIVEQMLRLALLLPPDERLSHIVVMGMGEPLANLTNVLAALDIASSPDGLGISPRRITISTVGLPTAMRRLAAERPSYHLAVSLHAPNDVLRSQIVPTNDKTGLKEILHAADEYFAASGRRLTFEYVLLAGVNDGPAQATELARLLRGRGVLLNLIPYNPVAGLPYAEPSRLAVDRFAATLEEVGVNVQTRRRKGDAIDAACGQLRRLRAEPVVHELGGGAS